MRSKLLLRVFFLCLSLLATHPAFADIDEIYKLSIGGNLERYNTNFSINSNGSGTDIGLEDRLGFDSNVNTGWISGSYRVGENHKIKLTYIPIRRSAIIENTRDIVLDNATIKSGALIASDNKNDILDFSYVYSAYKKPHMEVGISAGLYVLLTETRVVAAGEIQAEGEDQPVFKADYFSEQKFQAPLPLFGASINYEFSPSWRAHASMRYLSVQINETDGRIFSTEIGSEYYFNNNWGIGLSLTSFDLNVQIQGIISSTSLGWAHDGIQLYAVFKY